MQVINQGSKSAEPITHENEHHGLFS